MKTTLNVVVPESLIGETVPIRIGLPWPRSRLFDTSVTQVSTASDGVLEHQYAILEHWSDRSAKWALFDILVPVTSTDTAVELDINGEADSRADQARDDDIANVLAGDLQCRVGKPGQPEILAIDVSEGSGGHLSELSASLADQEGRKWRATIESVDVITRGSVRTSVKVAGFFARSNRRLPLLFEATLDFFTSVSAINVEFDIWNPQAAYHSGNAWDLGDPGSFEFDDLSVKIKGRADIERSFCRAEASGSIARDAGRRLEPVPGLQRWRQLGFPKPR